MTASDPESELFLATMRRLAPPGLAVQDARLALSLIGDAGDGVLADLGCGYGRHLRALEGLGVRGVLGVDRSRLLLGELVHEAPSALPLRADLRALPLRSGSLAGAFCFYSSMFLGTERDAAQALGEAARVLRPRGRLVLTTDNPLRLAAAPRASFLDDIAGLGVVREESTFDAREGIDCVARSLVRPSGERLDATFRIRYFAPAALAAVTSSVGLRLVRLEPDAPLTERTPQLVALFERA